MKRRNKIIFTSIAVILILTLVFTRELIMSKIQSVFYSTTITEVSKDEEKSIKEFLKNKKASLDISENNNYEGFNILEGDIKDNTVFFTGECHALGWNRDIEMKFLKYLNKNAGVKYFLKEMGYASTQLINKYLKTGDEDILNKIYRDLRGTAAYNREGYESWKKLYEYNKTLSGDNKITVVGVDIEHQVYTAYFYLNELLPKENAPKLIEKSINELKQYEGKLPDAEKLYEDINKHEKEYKEYLKYKFFDFKFVVSNIINREKTYASDKTFNNIRERSICDNFKKIYAHLPKGKYYGQWGSEHVYQKRHISKFQPDENFATFLNENSNSPVKGKVISIASVHKNCELLAWYNQYKSEKVDEKMGLKDILSSLSEEDVTLFKLTGKNSPFKNKPYIIDNPSDGNTLDYFEYVLLIKNSPPATMF